jgi:2-oxoisovalerate dehydrogenase E1 component
MPAWISAFLFLAQLFEANTEFMAGEPIMMPHGDLRVSEAKVERWLKEVGATVTKGGSVVEVETDKAVMEVEAPIAGNLIQVLAPIDRIVKMGETLGILAP